MKTVVGNSLVVPIENVRKNKTYYVKTANGGFYKLHRITDYPAEKYAFVSLHDSDCWMNGEFSSFKIAIEKTLKADYEVFEIEGLQDLIAFLSDSKN